MAGGGGQAPNLRRTGDANFLNPENGEGGTGPITGEQFTQWADRLRDVEEMIDLPDLRNEVARAREQARGIRSEFKKAGTKPDWAVVRTQVSDRLLEVRNRLSEELARREKPDSLVPIDRDPVPGKFSDLVRRYYEKLGSAEKAP